MRYAAIVIGLLLFVTAVVGITSAVSNPDFNYSVGNDIVMIWNVTNKTGTFTVPAGVTQIQYLIVGGGGNAGNAAGGSTAEGGGGGGGGVLQCLTYAVTEGENYTITVGNGTKMTGWTHSQNSTLGNLTAMGGGQGGEGYGYPTTAYGEHGYQGGSGGGGGSGTCALRGGGVGGANVTGQGTYGQDGATCYAGVGGGAGGTLPGATGVWSPISSNITGYNNTYGEGGHIPPPSETHCINYGGIGSGTSQSIPSCLPAQAGHDGIVVIRIVGVPTPVSSFIPNGSVEGIAPFHVQFNDTSTGGPTTWNWSYVGNGTNTSSGIFSTIQNATGVFTTGNYSIRLNVTNIKYGNSSTQITWINVSTAVVNFTPLGLKVGWDKSRINFTGESNIPSPTSWAWSYVGYGTNTSSGSFGSNSNQTSGVFALGNYSISLTVTNGSATATSSQITWINISTPYSNPEYFDQSENCIVYYYTPKNMTQVDLPYIFVIPDLKYFQTSMKYLLVGGGGDAGGSHQFEYKPSAWGGGGGAGGFIYNSSFTGSSNSIVYIESGNRSENSSIVSEEFPLITAYAGGKGGEGYPDTVSYGTPGADGGSGGGGGSGGAGAWECKAPGGNGTAGQGNNGYCAYGGYALATSGGGGGAGGAATSPSGGPGVTNNITFYTETYSEGGSGGDTGYRPCKATFGSGGRADWSPYVESCDEGQPGIVIFQMCYGSLINIEAPPKIVQFNVYSNNGDVLPNAHVAIQGFTTTSGSWDWLLRLLHIQIDETPINTQLMEGDTGSAGQIEFLMVPTTKYNVTTTLDGYTFSPMYVYPHDSEYVIIADNNQTQNGWIVVDPLDSGTKSVTVSHTHVSQTEGSITIVYNDTGLTTTGGFINVSDKGVQLYSIPVTGNYSSETRNITIASEGTSLLIKSQIITTTDLYQESDTVFFEGYAPSKPAGIEPNVLMWTSFGIILLTSLLTRYVSARQVSVMICVEAWLFLSAGWFTPMTDKIGILQVIGLFGLATVLCVIWNMKEGFEYA